MPPDQSEWLHKIYTPRATTYDESWHPAFAWRIVDILSPSPGAHILDLACGTGLVTYNAASRVLPQGRVLGVDLNEAMLATAEAKLINSASKYGPDPHSIVSLKRHDIASLSTLDTLKGTEGTWDAITCASAFVWLQRPREVVASWVHFLRRDTGRLVLDVPHEHNVRAGIIYETVARRLGLAFGVNRSWATGKDALLELLEGAGLQVEKIEFVEQKGEGARVLDGTEEEARRVLEGSPWLFKCVEGTDDEFDRLKKGFVEEWVKIGRVEGGVRDVDGVWVAVAKRM